MPTKSKYDLKGAQHVKIPSSIWEKYVEKFGKDQASEMIRDDLDLCIGVERQETAKDEKTEE